ncbi:MAG: hypothetical protein HQL70_03500 [Magnetococcales bacterium]|nr:hypothetical protein [Magnetococcales bacterium]
MNNKPVSTFRLITIWISVFTVTLLLINFTAAIVLSFLQEKEKLDIFANGDKLPDYTRNQFRFRLPNYNDKNRAREIYRDLDRLQATYRPYVAWSMEPYQGKTVTIAASGERVYPPLLADRNSNVVKRFFGGSTMWGVGVEDKDTIPALFNAKQPNTAVYNHGQFSYNSRQELALLLNLLSSGEHLGDVLFYDGVNDVAVNCRADTGLNSHNREKKMRRMINAYPQARKLQQEGPGLLDSFRGLFIGAIQNLFIELKRDKSPRKTSSWDREHWTCHKDPAKAQMVADNLLKNWQLAHDLVTKAGGSFQAVLQPVALFANPRLDHIEQELAYWGSELPAQYRAVYPLLLKGIKKLDVEWITDASSLFDGDELFYIDFAHVTANGNQRIAELILEQR